VAVDGDLPPKEKGRASQHDHFVDLFPGTEDDEKEEEEARGRSPGIRVVPKEKGEWEAREGKGKSFAYQEKKKLPILKKKGRVRGLPLTWESLSLPSS